MGNTGSYPFGATRKFTGARLLLSHPSAEEPSSSAPSLGVYSLA
jgi:hypothetical protein